MQGNGHASGSLDTAWRETDRKSTAYPFTLSTSLNQIILLRTKRSRSNWIWEGDEEEGETRVKPGGEIECSGGFQRSGAECNGDARLDAQHLLAGFGVQPGMSDPIANAVIEVSRARTADLTQVRSAPPTCKRTPHCKDNKHGGRVRRYGSRGCHANPQPFLEDDDRPGVPLTRIKPHTTQGHDRGFPRPHQLGPSTSEDGADHNLIHTPTGAFDGSSTSTPANGVTDGPKPGNPASRRGATTSGRRGAITSGPRGATTSGPSFADPNANPISKSLL
ncbi:hypothetical protein BHE74_00043892 [Ensete ventricosum]|nr:hypothetical protein BHE74_00043892 [Ensete ventricosum]